MWEQCGGEGADGGAGGAECQELSLSGVKFRLASSKHHVNNMKVNIEGNTVIHLELIRVQFLALLVHVVKLL